MSLPDHYDPHAEAPASVVQGLANLRPRMHLRYNRRGRLIPQKSGSFDANGHARHKEYEPRWEVWDVTEEGREYRVMIVEDPDTREGMRPGDWLVERFRKYNPENHASLDACLEFAWKDQHRDGNGEAWRDFIDFMGEWCWDHMQHVARNRFFQTTGATT